MEEAFHFFSHLGGLIGGTVIVRATYAISAPVVNQSLEHPVRAQLIDFTESALRMRWMSLRPRIFKTNRIAQGLLATRSGRKKIKHWGWSRGTYENCQLIVRHTHVRLITEQAS